MRIDEALSFLRKATENFVFLMHIFIDLKKTIFKHSSISLPIAAHQLSYYKQLASPPAPNLLTPAVVGSVLLNTQQPPTSCQPAVWNEPSEGQEAMLLGATLSPYETKASILFCCSHAHTITIITLSIVLT